MTDSSVAGNRASDFADQAIGLVRGNTPSGVFLSPRSGSAGVGLLDREHPHCGEQRVSCGLLTRPQPTDDLLDGPAHCLGDEAAPFAGTDDAVEIADQGVIKRDVQTHGHRTAHINDVMRQRIGSRDAGTT